MYLERALVAIAYYFLQRCNKVSRHMFSNLRKAEIGKAEELVFGL